ncbi:MAG: hypothetical protein R3282_02105, partial [Rhodothermales bacterium]|nr:hypothetical protein [Rhodothermales bacterium]
RIVELVAAEPVPATVEVITSDRELRRRVSELGAAVRSAGSLLADLDAEDEIESDETESAPDGRG